MSNDSNGYVKRQGDAKTGRYHVSFYIGDLERSEANIIAERANELVDQWLNGDLFAKGAKA